MQEMIKTGIQPAGGLYVVGAGSRLFRSLGLAVEHVAVSGRLDACDELPAFPAGATILVLADPPDETQTRAVFLSLLSRVRYGSGCCLIYISSISAGFGASPVFPYEGPYARKKRAAEQLFFSREDLDVSVIRVGNVFEHGGWHAIRERCRWALLPAGFSSTARSTAAQVRSAVEQAMSAATGHRTLDAWCAEPSDSVFPRVVPVPGLLALYRIKALRLPVKLLGRGLRLLGVYLPAHDDLNSFLLA